MGGHGERSCDITSQSSRIRSCSRIGVCRNQTLYLHLVAKAHGGPRGTILRHHFSVWNLQRQLSASFESAEQTLGLSKHDIDSFKQMLAGASMWRLQLVYGIAILHLIMEYVAFSDFSFGKRKTSCGLSSTSLLIQAIMNNIMFLYIQEQRDMHLLIYLILFQLVLQLRKLWKMASLERTSSFPWVQLIDRPGTKALREDFSAKDGLEASCFKGVFWLLFPTIAGVCAYRLIYHRFTTWYSWIVLSLALCAQAIGFVVMLPQVLMNYRTKSVEHVPCCALVYQAINTFIDDVFMLCIRAPELQKYSVFRDDIIFLICLGQRWLYPKRPCGLEQHGSGSPQSTGAEPPEESIAPVQAASSVEASDLHSCSGLSTTVCRKSWPVESTDFF